MATPRVFVCVNERFDGERSCGSRGARALADALEQMGGDQIDVRRRKCLGLCAHGPNMRRDGAGFYVGVTLDDLPGIIDGTKPSNLDQIDQGDATDPAS